MGHTPTPVRLGLFGRNSGKIPERPRKRSQSVSWNIPREYGWDAPSPIIQGIWGFQSVSRILSPPVRLGAPLFSELVPERASQSRSWNFQQNWGYFWEDSPPKFRGRSVRNPLFYSIFWGPPLKFRRWIFTPKFKRHGLTGMSLCMYLNQTACLQDTLPHLETTSECNAPGPWLDISYIPLHSFEPPWKTLTSLNKESRPIFPRRQWHLEFSLSFFP